MDTLLKDGDHFRNSCGLPVAIYGIDQILQQLFIRLSIKKGSFPLDQSLGSNLYRLPRASKEQMNTLALSYIREALVYMQQVVVEKADCTYNPTYDKISIEITVSIRQERYELTVDVN